MIESGETNAQGTGASQEISTYTIARGISSIQEIPKKVEAVRDSLYYLLAKGRPLDSLFLLSKIDSRTLPFQEGERDRILEGILETAEGLLEKDPIEAWDTVWSITYSKARLGIFNERRDFTREEYERLDTQEFKDQQATTLARFIKCYLNPEIEIKGRERFARKSLASDMNDTSGALYHLDFDKVFDSLDEATRDNLLAVTWDHPLNVLKNKLQRVQEAREADTKAPTAGGQEVQENKPPVITEVAIEGSQDKIRLEVDGQDLGCEFKHYKDQGMKGVYTLSLKFLSEKSQHLNIPEGILVHLVETFDSDFDDNFRNVWIKGGEGRRLDEHDLFSLGVEAVEIYTRDWLNWETMKQATMEYEKPVAIYDSHGKLGWMSMEDLKKHPEDRKEDSGAQSVAEGTGENIKHFEGKPADFPKFLNDHLKASDQDRLAFSVSPEQLKEYIISMGKGKVQGGTIVPGEKEITIEGVKISMPGGKATLDLIIRNELLMGGQSIHGWIRNYKGNVITNRLRGQVENRIRDIDNTIRVHFNDMISNKAWSTEDMSIEDGNLVVGFRKKAVSRYSL